MNSPDPPAAGVHLFYLDDAGVLYSEATQELHLLNTTAAVIWSLLEEGQDAPAMSATLQQMYGLDAERSTQFVAAALAEWREKHFLADASPLPAATAPATKAAIPVDARAWSEPDVVEVRHYRILGSRIRLRFTSPELASVVRPILEHLEVREPSARQREIDIVAVDDGIVVYRDREASNRCTHVNQLAPIIKSLVWVMAVEDQEFFLDIHAGVVGDGSKCILLPAAAGSGKSTLTASLVHAGFEFFSDEVALLEEGSFNVFPVPLAICVKDTGIDALAGRFPILRELPLHHRGDGKRVAYMPPPPGSRSASDAAQPVAALIFPRFTQGASAALVPLAKYDALKRLLDECIVVSDGLDFARVQALVEWVSRTPCHALTYGSTEDAIAAVKSVFVANAGMGARVAGVARHA